MCVRPAHRGQGIDWQLGKRLIEGARHTGYERIILDSHISMIKAHEIYLSLGFKQVKVPDDFPEDHKPFVVFMECDLVGEP